jgi:hypothetical protein
MEIEKEKENRLLEKEISIRRKDEKWVKGICVFLNDVFLTLRINPSKEVSIPWDDVKEIISPADKNLEEFRESKK